MAAVLQSDDKKRMAIYTLNHSRPPFDFSCLCPGWFLSLGRLTRMAVFHTGL